ncbi:MAG: hypothetical protein J5493_08335 [Lachnospiraceae bacterium]|nr:hypothetical protein [Lachnospiraceae bacterium]
MKLLFFSLKKTLRTPLYWIFVLGILLLPPFFYHVGRHTAAPPSAYYMENPQDPDSALVAGYLDRAGFVSYPSEEALRRDVERGELEGGVLIPDDLTDRLTRGDYKGSLYFLISATSLLPDLWQNHTSAALLAVYAPYISARYLEEGGITLEEMKEAYQEMIQTGQLFHFVITARDGRAIPDTARSRRFFLGALSLLLFLGSYFCISAPLAETAAQQSLRIGRGRAFRTLYVPGVLLRGLGLAAAALGACLISGERGFVLPAAGALAAMLLFHLLLGLLPGRSWKDLLIIFIALFSLAIAPMYLDLSLLVPAIAKVRFLLPPCWVWFLSGML